MFGDQLNPENVGQLSGVRSVLLGRRRSSTQPGRRSRSGHSRYRYRTTKIPGYGRRRRPANDSPACRRPPCPNGQTWTASQSMPRAPRPDVRDEAVTADDCQVERAANGHAHSAPGEVCARSGETERARASARSTERMIQHIFTRASLPHDLTNQKADSNLRSALTCSGLGHTWSGRPATGRTRRPPPLRQRGKKIAGKANTPPHRRVIRLFVGRRWFQASRQNPRTFFIPRSQQRAAIHSVR